MRAAKSLPATIFITLLMGMLSCGAAMAAGADDLYRTRTTVTGQGETNRLIGFAVCLEQVLIKVSGAIRLEGDARLAPYKAKARDFVRSYDYRDQKLGKPKGDEQGTRDRPYDLTVEFDAARINEMLVALGVKPWLEGRPVIAMFIEMEQSARKFMVTSGEARSELQRAALMAAADRRGIQIVLPTAAAASALPSGDLLTMPTRPLALVAAGLSGEVVVVGRLTWNDQDLGWANEWRLDLKRDSQRWQFRSVTFDEAFRRAIGDAAAILSGAAATAKQAN